MSGGKQTPEAPAVCPCGGHAVGAKRWKTSLCSTIQYVKIHLWPFTYGPFHGRALLRLMGMRITLRITWEGHALCVQPAGSEPLDSKPVPGSCRDSETSDRQGERCWGPWVLHLVQVLDWKDPSGLGGGQWVTTTCMGRYEIISMSTMKMQELCQVTSADQHALVSVEMGSRTQSNRLGCQLYTCMYVRAQVLSTRPRRG